MKMCCITSCGQHSDDPFFDNIALGGFEPYMSSAMLSERAGKWNDHTRALVESKMQAAEEMSRKWVPSSERKTQTEVKQQDKSSGESCLEQKADVQSVTSDRPKKWMQKTSWRMRDTRAADQCKNEYLGEEHYAMGRVSKTEEVLEYWRK
jgi:hypothetical protein